MPTEDLARAAVAGRTGRDGGSWWWRRFLVGYPAVAAVLGGACALVWALTARGYFWPRWVWFGLAVPFVLVVSVRRASTGRVGRRRRLAVHGTIAAALTVIDVVIWLLSGLGGFWPIFPAIGQAILFGAHAWTLTRLPPEREQELVRRVDVLTRSRRGALDVQAAELRRIERDLHDGAQARIVSLAMSLGLAQRMLTTDPGAVAGVLAEARATALSALDDLRAVVHGIHPPVLADLGLTGAVQALALDMTLAVTVTGDLPGRPPPPVESAAYFAVAECLTNVVKHARATRAAVAIEYRDGLLSIRVDDDGVGGARLDAAGPGDGAAPDAPGRTGRQRTGLSGLARRLESFDGTIGLDSPAGGPTTVTLELPCELSSPKTTSFSGTG